MSKPRYIVRPIPSGVTPEEYEDAIAGLETVNGWDKPKKEGEKRG